MSGGGIWKLAMFTELEGEPPDVVMFGAAEDCWPSLLSSLINVCGFLALLTPWNKLETYQSPLQTDLFTSCHDTRQPTWRTNVFCTGTPEHVPGWHFVYTNLRHTRYSDSSLIAWHIFRWSGHSSFWQDREQHHIAWPREERRNGTWVSTLAQQLHRWDEGFRLLLAWCN